MRNNENTQRKILDAVNQIIKIDGIDALTIGSVSIFTGMDKNLISRCFGGVEDLLKAYIHERKFWNNSPEPDNFDFAVEEQIKEVLAEKSAHFFNHCEMEVILLNELSNGNILVNNLTREESPVDNSAFYDIVSTLLQAGTDHLLLSNYGIDNFKQPIDRKGIEQELMQSIGQIVDWTFG